MKLLELKGIFHNELDAIYGTQEVGSFFYMCTEHYLNVPRIQLSLEPEFTITKDEMTLFITALEHLKQQKPIQYLLGETEFYGLNFKVNENVLIPRPETEELVDLIIKAHASDAKNLKILDIGTGSGCIAISLAKNLPNAQVYALDVSSNALAVAKQNAEQHKVEITWVEASILDDATNAAWASEISFDVIVSNPPYVRVLEKVEIQPNVLENEPHLALFVEDDNPLVFYKAITNFALQKLKSKGALYFEINQYLGEETKALLKETEFENVVLLKDFSGNDRMLKGLKV
ncbi:peptide chain release factor N(5)-glutamine methyltransferase [Winogradskyella arenosi]|uniref:Release factor glutamine methyltransferase n=1 Tax=Winogradskyella arenosi TaxID=533325 RepID=A0A368ZCZ4_9FLAO|nr:peptide chain release factor N(5)-glutamine methyltransferase [Winogradskyella arenosi]RCW90903.1 release factor glutamine methyltransferase [Winogradskyella arenosi]